MVEILNHFRKIIVKGLKNLRSKLMYGSRFCLFALGNHILSSTVTQYTINERCSENSTFPTMF